MKLLQIETNSLVISGSELPLNSFRTVEEILNQVEPMSVNEASKPRLERGVRGGPMWHMDVPRGQPRKSLMRKIKHAPIVIGGLLTAGGCTVIQVNHLETKKIEAHPCAPDYSSRSPVPQKDQAELQNISGKEGK
jgi:hypothetical protein